MQLFKRFFMKTINERIQLIIKEWADNKQNRLAEMTGKDLPEIQ